MGAKVVAVVQCVPHRVGVFPRGTTELEVLAVALDRRSEHQYDAQRQVAQGVADEVLASFDVKRKEWAPKPGAGELYRGPPKG